MSFNDSAHTAEAIAAQLHFLNQWIKNNYATALVIIIRVLGITYKIKRIIIVHFEHLQYIFSSNMTQRPLLTMLVLRFATKISI